jgi:hypothetical protein
MKRKRKITFFFSHSFLFVGVTPAIQTLFQNEMLRDEKILWSGQPEQNLFLTVRNIVQIIFALVWLGITGSVGYFAIESFDIFTMLFLVPFVLIGLYLLFGSFIYSDYQKKRTYYAVTNQRVLILINSSNKVVKSKLISQIPVLNKTTNKDGIGTIQFESTAYMSDVNGSYTIDGLTFDNIKDVDTVYKLISDLRAPHEVF